MTEKNLRRRLPRLSRGRLRIADANYHMWESPDTSLWSDVERHWYDRARAALIAYIEGKNVVSIKTTWGFECGQLQEMLARTQMCNRHGKRLGFCALRKSAHLREGSRVSKLPSGLTPKAGQCRLGLQQILETLDLVEEFELRTLRKSEGKLLYKAINIQEWIRRELKERGYRQTEYPLNTATILYSAIAARMRKIRAENRDDSINAEGTERERKNLGVLDGTTSGRQTPRLLLEAEVDEHKIHAIGAVRININGVTKKIPGSRLSCILIAEKQSRAIFGGCLCFNPEMQEESAIEAFRAATVRGHVVYLSNGEVAPKFRPCDFHPELGGLVWAVTRLNNARIHTGEKFIETAERIGSQICYGPLYSWSAHAQVESYNGQLAREFKRLASATANASSFSINGSPADQAIIEEIDLVELERLFYDTLAYINWAANEGILYQKPIEYLMQEIAKGQTILRRLPPPRANNPEVGTFAHLISVKRRSKDNANLYVNADGWRYTGEHLSKRGDLLGKKIIVHIGRNRRTVVAFEASGIPIGTLTADGVWGLQDHTKDLRCAALRDKTLKKSDPNPMQRGADKFLARRAEKVAKDAETRSKGGVVQDATQLHGDMAFATGGTLNIQFSAETVAELPPPAGPDFLRKAAERARRAREARETLEREQK